jgi:hypothetical protein
MATQLTTPLVQDGSAASVIPGVIYGPYAYLDRIRHLTMDRPLDPKLAELEARLLTRLGIGLDVPPEVLTGYADVNHWNVAQVSEDTFKLHQEPVTIRAVEAITVGYMRSVLLDAGWPRELVDRVVVWFDPASLIAPRDQRDAANDAFDRGQISGKAYRRLLHLDEADAPEVEAAGADEPVGQTGMLATAARHRPGPGRRRLPGRVPPGQHHRTPRPGRVGAHRVPARHRRRAGGAHHRRRPLHRPRGAPRPPAGDTGGAPAEPPAASQPPRPPPGPGAHRRAAPPVPPPHADRPGPPHPPPGRRRRRPAPRPGTRREPAPREGPRQHHRRREGGRRARPPRRRRPRPHPRRRPRRRRLRAAAGGVRPAPRPSGPSGPPPPPRRPSTPRPASPASTGTTPTWPAPSPPSGTPSRTPRKPPGPPWRRAERPRHHPHVRPRPGRGPPGGARGQPRAARRHPRRPRRRRRPRPPPTPAPPPPATRYRPHLRAAPLRVHAGRRGRSPSNTSGPTASPPARSPRTPPWTGRCSRTSPTPPCPPRGPAGSGSAAPSCPATTRAATATTPPSTPTGTPATSRS